MKRKMYTKGHDINTLKKMDHNGGQFTAEEHAYIMEKEFGDTVFKTKNDLFREFFRGSWMQMPSLQFLMERVRNKGYQNVLSLGSGKCVLEYLLKLSMPENATVVASDFDTYFIEKAKQFFPEIRPVTFDFFKDDMHDLNNELQLKFDVAVFFFSAYVMDDAQFINIFSGLKDAGVKEIIDFHAGYMDARLMSHYILLPLKKNNLIRRMLGKPVIKNGDYIGKFHGYARSRAELRSLYKKCGLKIIKEISVKGCKYVAVLGNDQVR